MSQQTMVQNENKGGDKKRNKGKSRKKIKSIYMYGS